MRKKMESKCKLMMRRMRINTLMIGKVFKDKARNLVVTTQKVRIFQRMTMMMAHKEEL